MRYHDAVSDEDATHNPQTIACLGLSSNETNEVDTIVYGRQACIAEKDPTVDLSVVLQELALQFPANSRMQNAMQRFRRHFPTSVTAEGSGSRLQSRSKQEIKYDHLLSPEEVSAVSAHIEHDKTSTGRSGITSLLARMQSYLTAFATSLTAARGYFEASSSFRPEAYSLDKMGQDVMSYFHCRDMMKIARTLSAIF